MLKPMMAGCLLAILVCSSVHAQTNSTLVWQGVVRSYVTYLPAGYPAGGPYPVVVACHPGLSNATQHATATGWHLVGDTADFITVYPNAMPPGANPDSRLWNAYDQPSFVAQYDDVGFLLRLLDTLAAAHPVDTCRVYFSGFSSGAMMSFRMACDAADRIAAIAPVSGGWGYGADGSCGDGQCNGDPAGSCGWNMAYVNCTPQRQVPVAFMKGSLEGDNVPTCRASTDSLQRLHWVDFLDCTDPAIDTVQRAGETIVRERYDDCIPGSAYHFYTVVGNSHQWHTPATLMQWEFLRGWSRCELSTAIPTLGSVQPLQVQPNPFREGFTLAGVPPNARITVVDATGRAVYEGGPGAIRTSEWARGLYTVTVQDGRDVRHVRAVRE